MGFYGIVYSQVKIPIVLRIEGKTPDHDFI